MRRINIFVFGLLLVITGTDAAECENGWTAYKDELCIKSFSTLLSYHEAKDFCGGQGNEMAKASLVLIKEEDMQNLLVNYTNEMFDYVWLGSQYDEEAAEFRWDDGAPLTYTNWEPDYPRITNASNACVELRPVNAKNAMETGGKWADVNCQKRNQVMCQRKLLWSLQDAIDEIVRIRKLHLDDMEHLTTELQATKETLQSTQEDLQAAQDNLESTQQDLEITRQDLQVTKHDLQSVSSKVVPVGSIYIEYYNQPSPPTIWPTFTWEDISSTYTGLFFRVEGGGSEDWGVTQTECAPRITRVSGSYVYSDDNFPWGINLPASDWSDWRRSGYFVAGSYDRVGIERYYTGACEVRPKNQAVRIWKRTG